MTTNPLREAALAARNNAHVPYSNFPVGAAVEMEDGSIFSGGNVENSAYPQTICAERSAVVSAISAGKRSVRRVYVVAEPLSSPCGGCRSVLAELGSHDTEVILSNPAGQERRFRLTELLPYSFELKDDILALTAEREIDPATP